MYRPRTLFGLWVEVPDTGDDPGDMVAALRALADAIEAGKLEITEVNVNTPTWGPRQTLTMTYRPLTQR